MAPPAAGSRRPQPPLPPSKLVVVNCCLFHICHIWPPACHRRQSRRRPWQQTLDLQLYEHVYCGCTCACSYACRVKCQNCDGQYALQPGKWTCLHHINTSMTFQNDHIQNLLQICPVQCTWHARACHIGHLSLRLRERKTQAFLQNTNMQLYVRSNAHAGVTHCKACVSLTLYKTPNTHLSTHTSLSAWNVYTRLALFLHCL